MNTIQHIAATGVSLTSVMLTGVSEPVTRDFEIRHDYSERESTHSFDVRVELPDGFDPETDYAVVLFHGGVNLDIDWTMQGSYSMNGQTQQLTISGEPTKNGERIAEALLDAGYGVVRYSSIYRGDPKHAQDPAMVDPMTFPDTVDLARKVWDRASEEVGVPTDRMFALGHSLGATRAALVTEQPAGYVVLAGAYLSPTSVSVRKIVMTEQSEPVEGKDYDGSGTIERFERAASYAIENASYRDDAPFTNRGETYAWASDQLVSSGSPVLAMWGSLDSTSYHGPILSHIFKTDGASDRITSVYYPELGHDLSREVDGKTGPIERRVLDRIVAWLDDRVGM